jgi:hypothetical protein
MLRFNSFANQKFWKGYHALPTDVKLLSDKAYQLFKENPEHPSLHFKRVGKKHPIYSARISNSYHALCFLENENAYWFWIGNHDNYEQFLKEL